MDEQSKAMPIMHKDLDEVVLGHLESKQPLFILGSPGSGKTTHLRTACINARVSWAEKWYADRDLEYGGFDWVVLKMGEKDEADVRGVPKTVEEMLDGESLGWITKWCRPAEYPKQDCRPTVIAFDELLQARQSVSLLASPAFDQDSRKIGDYVLPDNVVVMGASNFHTDRAGAHRMATQTANRVFNYEMVIDPAQWCDDYAIKADIDRRIVSFIRTRPELVYQFDPKSASPSFPSLRMWENLSKILATISNDNHHMLKVYACGAVGMGAGTEFVGFVRAYDRLPSVADVIANPDKYDDPVEADLRYAMCGALGKYADDDNVEACWTYMIKMPEEYQVLWFQDVKANMKNSGFDITQHSVHGEIVTLLQDALNK